MVQVLRDHFGAIHFSGDFKSWEDALRRCTGYADSDIVGRAEAAALAVKRGEAAFERDAVTFPRIEYQTTVLAGLLVAASHARGELNVLDFGGGLGTSYQQNRALLSGLTRLRWCVVEQPSFVRSGKQHFEDSALQFFGDLDGCLAAVAPDVALLSSVLPYIEAPYALLDRLVAIGPRILIVDRTPFIDGRRDRLCIQRVNSRIYPGSYPAWFLARETFLARLSPRYRIVEEFQGELDRANIPASYLGYVFMRKSP